MTIAATRRAELRQLSATTGLTGDPEWDRIFRLKNAVPELLDEIDRLTEESSKWHKAGCDGIDNALEHGVREVDTLRQRLGCSEAAQELDRKTIADLDLRLSIATELNVNDRKQIERLETAISVANVVAGEAALVLEQQDRDLEKLRARVLELEAQWADLKPLC